jgi:hypothetical protein
VFAVQRRTTSSRQALVLHVVVGEECSVEELDGNGGVQCQLLAASQGATGCQAKRGSQAFPGPSRIAGDKLVEVRRTVIGDGLENGARRLFTVGMQPAFEVILVRARFVGLRP